MGIINRDNALYLATGIDNSGLNRGFSDAERRIEQFRSYAEKAGLAIGGYFGVQGLTGLIKQVVNVRSEFQNTEAMFKVFLGSAEKASSFMKEMQKYAFNNVFEFKDLTGQAAQLLAYGTEVENVTAVIDKLSNVAAGVNQPLERFVELYNKAKSRGKLDAVDVQQWSVMGDVVSYLAEMLGKSREETQALISSGKVGFKEMDQLLTNLTSSGGKFNTMMEEKMKTLGDSVGLLQDSLTAMFNELGEKSQDILRGGILTANALVENYEKVGKVLIGLIATYGTYRTAIALTTIAESGWTIAETAHFRVLVALEKAQKLLNATILKNPYVLAATVVVSLVAAMWALHDSTTASEKAQEDYNKKKEEAIELERTHKNEIEELINTATNQALADLERVNALEELKKKYPQIFEKYDTEKLKLADILSLKKQIAEFDAKEKKKKTQSDYENTKKEAEKATAKYNQLLANNTYTSNYQAKISLAKDEMDKRNEELKLYEKDLQTDRINSFIANIGQMTDIQIKAELEARKRIQNRMLSEKSSTGSTQGGVLDGAFDADQIKQQTDALQREYERRNQTKYSYLELDKKYNAELAALQAERKKIETDKSQYTTDELQKKLKQIDDNIAAKQQEIKELTGKSVKDEEQLGKSGESAFEKARKSNDEQAKFLRDQARKLVDIQHETSQARVDALRDGADKELEQIKLNHEKELEQLKRNKEDTLQALIDNEKKKFYDDSKNKNKTFDSSSVQLSKEVEDYFASIESYTKKRQGNDITQFYDDTFDNILEEYRTFEEKQNKIALKYIDLRAKAMESGNLQMLEQINKAETKEMSSLNLEDFKDKINWEQVFGDLDKVSTRALIDLRDKLRSYLESAGDSISIQDLKAVSEAIDNIDIKLADKQPLAELKSGYEGYKLAIEDVVKAKEKLSELEEKTPEYIAATKELEKAESKRNASLVKMSKATNEIGRKGAEIVNAGTDIINMLESFGMRMPEQVSRSLDGIRQIMSGLESIDLKKPFSIITGSIKMITGLGKTISGALGLGKGADYKRYNAMKEQYDKLNTVWDELINKKKEYISISYGDEAVKAGKEAEALIQKSVESSRTLGREFLNSGASVGSSSKGVRQRKNMSSDGWEQLEQWKKSNNISNDLYGSIKGGRMTGLFDLTAEQLEKLKEDAPTFWAKLHGETQEYLNNIISGAEKIEDIHKSVKEQLTQISFDSFRNSFLDTLADMTSDSQTFANNFQKQLQNSILNSLMAKKYDDKIKSLYDRWASYGDGNLSDYEYEALKKEQEQIVNDMLADREKYKDAFKWNSSDDVQGIKGIAASITQDSANELNANFYALRQSVNDIRNINKQNQDYLKVQNVFVSDIKDAVQGYKQVFSDQLEYQRQIASNTYTTTVLLKEIRDNGLIIKK